MTTNPYDCPCKSCEVVKQNLKNNVWINDGKPYESILNKTPLTPTFEIPNEPISFKDHGIERKPKNVWWFSCGSWLFDRHGNSDHKDNEYEMTSIKVFAVRNPKNTLYIKTYEDMENFTKKYGEMIKDDETLNRERQIKNLRDHIIVEKILNNHEMETKMINNIKQCLSKHDVLFENFMQHLRDIAKIMTVTESSAPKELINRMPELANIKIINDEDNYSIRTPQEDFIHRISNTYFVVLRIRYLLTIQDTHCFSGKIDWDKIKNDGWWAIAFTFRKVKHLVKNLSDDQFYRFLWHSGYDVETLCVFDPRAVENCTSIEEITI